MIFTLLYLVMCIMSTHISLNLYFLLGAILLDIFFDFPTIKIVHKYETRK